MTSAIQRDQRKTTTTLWFGRVFCLLLVVWIVLSILFLQHILVYENDGLSSTAAAETSPFEHVAAAAAAVDRVPKKINPRPLPLRFPRINITSQLSQKKYLVLSTIFGKIRIRLRPDWSRGSVDYIHQMIENRCARCYFHRLDKTTTTTTEKNRNHHYHHQNDNNQAEEGMILGVVANHNVPLNTEFGSCPKGAQKTASAKNITNDCQYWNRKACGCHGPVLTQGMVGWVEGTAGGPTFFINHYETETEARERFGTQHTVFGEVTRRDKASLAVIDRIMEEPTLFETVYVLRSRVEFDISLE